MTILAHDKPEHEASSNTHVVQGKEVTRSEGAHERRRRAAAPLLAVLLIGSVGACAAANEEHTEAEQPLYSAKGTTFWTNNGNTIPMCWYTDLFEPPPDGVSWETEKQYVIDAISSTWASVANIDVTWEECPKSGPDRHIRAKLVGPVDGASNGYVTQLGMQGLKADSAPLADDILSVSNFTFGLNVAPDWNANDATRARFHQVILHEFGHVLGFSHEHDRPDAPYCPGADKSYVGIPITPKFDPLSIMASTGYCTDLDALSDGDVTGVRSIYGGRNEEFKGQFDTRPLETTFLYAEKFTGELLWSRGDTRGGATGWRGPLQVGSGWNGLVDVTGAGGDRFYGRTPNGDLLWYEHTGFNDGTWNWKQPVQVGWGWDAISRMVAGGDGVIYAVMPNGDLRWYKHLGFETGAFSWAGPTTVGYGWGDFKQLFSSGDGIIYAIQNDGHLVWYRHRGVGDGSFRWDGPVTVGYGWQDMVKVFSPGGGIIYALQPDGTLMRYKHRTWNGPQATFSWDPPQVLGTGWQGLRDIFTLAPMHAAGPR